MRRARSHATDLAQFFLASSVSLPLLYQPAAAESVGEIDRQTNGHPHKKPDPRHLWQFEHEVTTCGDCTQRHPWDQRRFEWTRAVRFPPSQEENARGHKDKGKQCPD